MELYDEVSHVELGDLPELRTVLEDLPEKFQIHIIPTTILQNTHVPWDIEEETDQLQPLEPVEPGGLEGPLDQQLTDDGLPDHDLQLAPESGLDDPLVDEQKETLQADPTTIIATTIITRVPEPQPEERQHGTEVQELEP